MCDSSSTASELAKTSDFDAWNHARGNKFDIKRTSNGGQYIILINGATDAEFVITNLNYLSATAASVIRQDKHTSLAIEGNMTISEPRGILLMDKLVESALRLGIDPANIVFSLKTFFVGYTDIPENPTEHITDIEPLQFVATDLSGTFTEGGGLYKMSFAAISHGSARLPQYSKALEGLSVNLSESSDATLKTAMQKLENKINQKYNKHFDCVVSSVRSQMENRGVPIDKINQTIDAYSRVSYSIELAEEYQDPFYTVTNQPAQQKNVGGDCEEGVIAKSATGTSVEAFIRKIMEMSVQVQEEIKVGDANGIKQEYKIHTTVNSFPDPNDNTKILYEVKYFIDKFPVPRGIPIEQLINSENADDAEIQTRLKENTIEFDYIYSGKNIDILNFDIKLNLGLAYIQTATISNSLKDQTEDALSRSTHINSEAAVNVETRLGETLSTPIFFGTQIREPLTHNSQVPNITSDAQYNLSKHSSLELTESSVKITGNYRLLNTINRFTNPDNLGVDPDVITGTGDEPEDADLRHWGYFPSFAKINIFMPRSNDDIAFFESGNRDSFTKPFWYQGYYYIYGIINDFDEGTFTQTLQVLAMPDASTFDSISAGKKLNESFITPDENCYDSKVNCDNSENQKAQSFERLSPQEKLQIEEDPDIKKNAGETPPANSEEADDLNQGGVPEDVKGFSQASPEVQAAIKRAAKIVGVDARILAQMAKIESNFDPTARPPFISGSSPKKRLSSATGLFQHLDATWMTQVKEGKIDDKAGGGIPPNTPASIAKPQRTNPLLSAIGGAHLMKVNQIRVGSEPSEIYMGHFLGEGDARKIVKAINSGNGNATTESVLGSKTASRIKRANPNVPLNTPNEIKDWAARKMANTLIKGIKVVKPKNTSASQVASAPVTQRSSTENKRRAVDNIAATTDCAAKEEKSKTTVECGSGKKPENKKANITPEQTDVERTKSRFNTFG